MYLKQPYNLKLGIIHFSPHVIWRHYWTQLEDIRKIIIIIICFWSIPIIYINPTMIMLNNSAFCFGFLNPPAAG